MNAIKLKPKSLLLVALMAAYAVMWIGGVGHYVWYGESPMDAPWAASVFLLLAGLLVAFTSGRKDLIGLFIAAAIGFIAEILGVRYGFIFSPYRYTEVLQPQLFDVPLVMLSAWMVLVAYCRQMLMSLNLPLWIEVALAALWMTAIDLVIDPLAANQLGYWRWAGSSAYYGIPLRNFIGWFVVSLIIFVSVPRAVASVSPSIDRLRRQRSLPLAVLIRQKPQPNPCARYVGLSIVLFFTSIALSYGLMLAGGVGLTLCLAHAAVIAYIRASRNRVTTGY